MQVMKLQSKGFLTTEERSKLDALEKVIAKNKRAFVEIAVALTEIKEAKLYRQCHKTFAEYCEKKWGFGRQYAYEMIRAAEAVKSLPENVNDRLQNLEQARALASVPEAKRVEVLDKAHARAEEEDRPVTARDISEAAEEKRPRVQSADQVMGFDKVVEEWLIGLLERHGVAVADYRVARRAIALWCEHGPKRWTDKVTDAARVIQERYRK